MNPRDISIFRDVERKLDKEGVDLAHIDVLVHRGEVTLTGHFMDRISHRDLTDLEINRIKQILLHIPGVSEVIIHQAKASAFV
ncbi:MAG: BON domain-containing protein [bacterium]|nr:BON domain-containing protein [bacterium]